MTFYYILHSIFPIVEGEHGQRNCRIFLIGMMLYLAVYLLIWNLTIMGKICSVMKDAYLVALYLTFLSDIFVMGYVYRSYFGRSLLHEMPFKAESSDPCWKFNPDTHTYEHDPSAEVSSLSIAEPYDKLNQVVPLLSVLFDGKNSSGDTIGVYDNDTDTDDDDTIDDDTDDDDDDRRSQTKGSKKARNHPPVVHDK